jgi:hypothetical protein
MQHVLALRVSASNVSCSDIWNYVIRPASDTWPYVFQPPSPEVTMDLRVLARKVTLITLGPTCFGLQRHLKRDLDLRCFGPQGHLL